MSNFNVEIWILDVEISILDVEISILDAEMFILKSWVTLFMSFEISVNDLRQDLELHLWIIPSGLEILSWGVDILPHYPEMQQHYLDVQILNKDNVRCPKLPVVVSGRESVFIISYIVMHLYTFRSSIKISFKMRCSHFKLGCQDLDTLVVSLRFRILFIKLKLP